MAETADNQLVAADAKLNFDDNAAYRQKEIFTLRDTTQEDPREVYSHSLLFVFYITWELNILSLNPSIITTQVQGFSTHPWCIFGLGSRYMASPICQYMTQYYRTSFVTTWDK